MRDIAASLHAADAGFQALGFEELESCPQFRLNNYYGYVYTETCLDSGIRIHTELDLNSMYGVGVMTGILDRNPSDSGGCD